MTFDSGVAAGGSLETVGLPGSAWTAPVDPRRAPLRVATVRPPSPAACALEFEQEAMPHVRSLYATAYRLTRNSADAEDLVQETCLRAFRAWSTYTPGTNVRAWLYTILHRARTDALRRMGRSPSTVELVGDGPGVKPAQDALASGHEDLDRALSALPDVFRTAILMREVEDLRYDEIAQVLQVPIGTVMSRIHRGRALLRKALAA